MSLALTTGVTGLKAHQQMLDVAGNNLANVTTTAYKASRITFSQLLSETIKNASKPTGSIGGTNPQQMGCGVGIAGITSDLTQGNIINTGNPLDLAIEGDGYFVVSKGSEHFYTRAGTFGVDADSYLVDTSTGYRVQRYGTEGEGEGFQASGDTRVRVPYEAALPANATSAIKVRGNLSTDAQLSTTQKQVLRSNITYTTDGTTAAIGDTKIAELDEYTGTLTSGTITFSGYKPDGTALTETGSSWVDLTMDVTATTTLDNVLTYLNTNDGITVRNEKQTIALTYTNPPTGGTFTLSFGGAGPSATIPWTGTAAQVKAALEGLATIDEVTVTGGPFPGGTIEIEFTGDLVKEKDVGDITMDISGLTGASADLTGVVTETTKGRDAVRGVLGGDATAALTNGKIVITDATAGYSKSDLTMAWSGNGTLTTPGYFELATVGGEEVQNVNITIYDSNGGAHVFSGAFARTNFDNRWDMVLTSVTGNVNQITMTNRRIEGIDFTASDGSYAGLDTGVGDTAQFTITFAHDTANPQTISVDLGTIGKFDGLTQFSTGASGTSTAVVREQDGYGEGNLSTVSINNQGIAIGLFSNGIKKNIATIQIALFQNPAGLESVDNGYFIASANSGDAIPTQGLASGAGSIRGGALEKSNVNEADQFVALIEAQNGYQANARTIRIANEMLRELANIIR